MSSYLVITWMLLYVLNVSKRLNLWILPLIMKRNAPNVVELELSMVKIDVILVISVLRKQAKSIVLF
ncbi:hypothetical protein [Candidatus Nitrosocosmicus franklandus]|uniref:Uncharacterized protein n=1 Tax=Candidatus Nitrosocosmicus franklandianus TaxID=1798806 RepID=A0A484I963_9ARCH|nr:hypothetical protein [Candidatus Nitrosocosmicus franklandus]VFJ13761.1 protein of unknown function [Candidatus Nitrosocosmicus franklandus]